MYTILEKIGQGAAGEVFKAQDTNLSRFVAIKVLRPSLASEDLFVERFRREAMITSRLNHPNIVSLYSFEKTDDSWQMAMEYVKGMSIGQLISRFGSQKPRYALEIVKQIANALAVAHENQVIHRDIKPNNILLSDDGVVKVSDFGLARVIYEDSDLTQFGGVVGTPRYMSPEQVDGEALNAQTDLYSLGVVLYELISGRPLYEISDPLVIMRQIADHPFPDIRKHRPELDPCVVKILAKMTSKDRGQRYADAKSLANDITSYLKTGRAPLAQAFDSAVESELPGHPTPTADEVAAKPGDSPSTVIVHYVRADAETACRIAAVIRTAGHPVYRILHHTDGSGDSLASVLGGGQSRTELLRVVSPEYVAQVAEGPAGTSPASAVRPGGRSILVRRLEGRVPAWMGKTADLCDCDEIEARRRIGELFPPKTRPSSGKTTTASAPAGSTGERFEPFSLPESGDVGVVGRRESLAEIARYFEEGGRVLSLCPAHQEYAGVGTSTLAAEYARRNRDRYTHVWRVRADNPEDLIQDYSRIYEALGLSEPGHANPSLRSKVVRKWLQHNENWLIIFDGARKPSQITALLPAELRGHVLVPTTSIRWPASTARIEVQALSRSESIEYMAKVARRPPNRATNQVCEYLGDLPLGLRIAARYIAHRNMPYSEYAEVLVERHRLMWGAPDARIPADEALATAFSLTLEQVEVESPPAYSLAKICAYLSPNEVPLSILKSKAALLPRMLGDVFKHEATTRSACRLLLDFGVMQGPESAPHIHEAVQKLLRKSDTEVPADLEGPEPGARSGSPHDVGSHFDDMDWLGAGLLAAADIAETYLRDGSGEEVFANFRSHSRRLLRHARRLKTGQAERAGILAGLARHCAAQHEFRRASGDFKSAIELREQVAGRSDESVSRLYKELAAMSQEAEEFREAIEAYESPLEIDRSLERKGNTERAALLRTIGNLATRLEDFGRARSCFEAALNIDLNARSAPNPEIGYDHALLGGALESLGLQTPAWEHYLKALENYEGAFGPTHESVGRAARSLGMLLVRMEDPAEARKYFKRALSVTLAAGGDKQPIVAGDYERLARLDLLLDMPGMAKEHFEMAMDIHRRLYGEGHLRVAYNLKDVGDILLAQGHLRQAEERHRRALDVFLRVLGPGHDQTKALVRALNTSSNA